MNDQIRTGAYVIRNKRTSGVLHIEDQNPTKTTSIVISFQQHENRYREQQLWWIEPLPYSEDKNYSEEVVYSITNISAGMALDLNPEIKDGKKLGM